MGDNINDGKFYFKVNESGEFKEIELMNIPISYPTPNAIDDISVLNENTVLEVNYNMDYCSRKRFIKLLMGDLYQRNEANRIADSFFKKYGYYSYWVAVLMGAIKWEE